MMTFHTRPLLSATASSLALLCGVGLLVGLAALPEAQSIRTFFVLLPATLLLAGTGYLLASKTPTLARSPLALIGYLLGGGVLLATLLLFLWPGLLG